jgi:hypothetical protein
MCNNLLLIFEMNRPKTRKVQEERQMSWEPLIRQDNSSVATLSWARRRHRYVCTCKSNLAGQLFLGESKRPRRICRVVTASTYGMRPYVSPSFYRLSETENTCHTTSGLWRQNVMYVCTEQIG